MCCQYIKEDGEQCGIDSEPFCRHHEDTAQAAQYAAGADSAGIEMQHTCTACGTALRRVERVTEHPNIGGRLQFEAAVECDCSEYVLGVAGDRFANLPDGWHDGE